VDRRHLFAVDAAVLHFHGAFRLLILILIKKHNSPAPRPKLGIGEQMSESGRLETASVPFGCDGAIAEQADAPFQFRIPAKLFLRR
jgi:hypothetical protein